MSPLQRLASLGLCAGLAILGLGSCATQLIPGEHTVPGPGPGGKPMRTGSDAAVGMPPVATTPIYPLTARIEVNDNYFGTKVADPYRWMENLDSPQVHQWVLAENAVSQPQLAALPQRPWLKRRLGELWNYERYEVPVHRGAHYFYLHNDGRQNQSVLFVADSLEASGRVLFDPNAVREDATVAVSDFEPSEQGAVVAYAISDGGTDWQIWRFRRVTDGSDFPEALHDTKFWGVSWARDGSGVYYSRYPEVSVGKGDDAARPAVYFHKLGTPQDADRLVYAIQDQTTRIPQARVTEDGRYLVITQVEGTQKNGVVLMDLSHPGSPAQPLLMDWDALYNFIGSQGDELYFHTTQGAPLGRVMAVDAHQGTSRRTVVSEGTAAIEAASYVGGRIVVQYVEDAHGVARLYESSGRLAGTVPLPGLGGIEGFRGEGTSRETFFSYTDYLTPRRIYRLDVATDQATLWREPRVPASMEAFVTEQVFYTSKDGTRVPMYITHRRDLAKNGDHPVLLYGYGGFNISATPAYRPQVQAWLEMGGIFAEANLRGGGEYGEAWHQAGSVENKQHVFDDFIAAAEYLIQRALHAPRAFRDPRPQQRRAPGGRGAHAAAGALRRGAPGGGGARHAALSHRQRQRPAVVLRLRPVRGPGAVPGALRLLPGAEREEGHVLSADPHHHRRPRRSRGALAQLQVRRRAAGGAGLRQSHPDPHRDARRARRGEAGVDAGG